MAILLNTTLSNAVSANYFRISRLTIDRNRQMILVDMSLYLSKEIKLAGNDPVQLMTIDLSNSYNTLTTQTMNNIIESVYQEIMLLPQFNGCVAG